MRLKVVKTFTDRYPFVGPAIWILCIQYFFIQYIVAHAWSSGYSLRHNLISDLGNTACGLYTGRYVCSPLHSLMNASFIMLGVTMAVGSLLIYQEFRESRTSLVGFGLMGIAGVGTIVVGLVPENTVNWIHTAGASLPFILGNVCLVVLGFALKVPKGMRIYAIISGVVALSAFGLFTIHVYLGLDPGGMERLISYPQTLWLIVFGIYISSNHFARRSLGKKAAVTSA